MCSKFIFISLLYIFSIPAIHATYILSSDYKINATIKKALPNSSTEQFNVLQQKTLFKIIERKCKSFPNNISKYIANIEGEKIIPLPAKFMPPLYYSFYNNRIIFSGCSQTGLITIIVDSNSLKILDILLHFALSDKYPIFQSPSGRYLLFKKFSPRSAPCSIFSDFIMIYDLEKSPKDNRIHGNFDGTLSVTINNSEVGHFFYPENKDFEFSIDSQYFTQVNSPEKQIFLYSTEWDVKNNIAVISEKSKLSNYKFIVISDRQNGIIIKKIYNLNQGKLYTKDNIEIKYQHGMDFFMNGFEIINNTLYIYNGAEGSILSYARFNLDLED